MVRRVSLSVGAPVREIASSIPNLLRRAQNAVIETCGWALAT